MVTYKIIEINRLKNQITLLYEKTGAYFYYTFHQAIPQDLKLGERFSLLDIAVRAHVRAAK